MLAPPLQRIHDWIRQFVTTKRPEFIELSTPAATRDDLLAEWNHRLRLRAQINHDIKGIPKKEDTRFIDEPRPRKGRGPSRWATSQHNLLLGQRHENLAALRRLAQQLNATRGPNDPVYSVK